MLSKEEILKEEHDKFIDGDLFCQMIKERIEYSNYYKYGGIAPEGFIMIPEITLERFNDRDFWEEWKKNPSILIDHIKRDSKNI